MIKNRMVILSRDLATYKINKDFGTLKLLFFKNVL